MKNIENKEGSCKYYVPHYVKVGNSFITCRAGHCKLQKKEGVLIDEDKKICECFEAQDMAEYLKKTTGTPQEMQSGTFEKYGRIAKAVGELKNARKFSVRFL